LVFCYCLSKFFFCSVSTNALLWKKDIIASHDMVFDTTIYPKRLFSFSVLSNNSVDLAFGDVKEKGAASHIWLCLLFSTVHTFTNFCNFLCLFCFRFFFCHSKVIGSFPKFFVRLEARSHTTHSNRQSALLSC
jgi:hypothetical protein